MTKNEINKILDILEKTYPDAKCALRHKNTFELIIAVVLSAQTTDKSVNKITPELFQNYPDAKSLAGADIAKLEKIIRPIGMYKTKSKNIKNLAKVLYENFQGKVPGEYDKLTELPGVGRKTANVVLSVGFGEQRIAVDTHVFRVSQRIGLAKGKTTFEVEEGLMKNIPKDRWSRTHHSLIFHGRNCCTARKPKCEECSLAKLCKFNNKNK